MGLTHQNILEIRITTSPREIILEDIKKWLDNGRWIAGKKKKRTQEPLVIATPNPEQIVLAQQNISFKEMLNQADVTLPDGIGLVIASRFLFGSTVKRQTSKVTSRISGVDFMQDLVQVAAERSVRIGLIGGKPGLAVKALECLRETYPRLEAWADEGPEIMVGNDGNIEGPIDTYWVTLAKRIVATKTQMVFVGLGAPKQEYVISRLARALSSQGGEVLSASRQESQQGRRAESARDDKGIILMSVGGSFDMITGRLKRAPVFIRSIGFEWVWRLCQEPWRWKRQLALLRFVVLILRERLTMHFS